MTELELEQLPATEADEDSQSVNATLGDVRRIFREEMQTAGLVTQNDLERALERERFNTTSALENRINAEREQTTAQLNQSQSSTHEAIREITRTMQRIEDNITGTIGMVTAALKTQVETSLDNNRRIGVLETKEDTLSEQFNQFREHFTLFTDDIQRGMSEVNNVLRGNPKTDSPGLVGRMTNTVGTIAQVQGEVESIQKELQLVKASVASIEAFFNAVRGVWREATRTTARKVVTAGASTLFVSIVIYVGEQVIPTILKVLGG